MTLSNLFLKSCRKGVGGDEPEHASECLLGVPEVILLLTIEPEAWCRTRETRQTRGHLRADGGRAGKDPVKGLTRDAQLAGRLADGEAKARQNPITQSRAWMGRRPREGVSGAGHAVILVERTVALWVTGHRKQGLHRSEHDQSGHSHDKLLGSATFLHPSRSRKVSSGSRAGYRCIKREVRLT